MARHDGEANGRQCGCVVRLQKNLDLWERWAYSSSPLFAVGR